MLNLAGRTDADHIIRHELRRVGIEPTFSDARKDHPDVKTSVVGKLGPFEFRRNWRYWVALGPVPLSVAEELYTDPVCCTDVRAGGDCACRPPQMWATYFDADDKELVIDDPDGGKRLEYLSLVEKGLLPREGFDRLSWVRSSDHETRSASAQVLRALAARAIVDTFHIDSELGLYLFVQALRRRGLVMPKLDEAWEGVMVTYTECDFPGAEPYRRTVPGWKCKTCGRQFGTSGPPPERCNGCGATRSREIRS